ncbi:aquaporin [Cellulomonas oligotrophica]|uniref:Glycerol uptake facilitator-like aquaporin n=1 Tax=Cellulomonas oligotrophica TaxID=931536 RepID=A0A7Y9FF12_9CELL|nr:MIP/aquaporin family protein [Cellulomonas oligotrophica]NYD85792.1 glycerol uptake facilitator-like aquaporin [Cellulomonas oligotrophica]GIG31202.1 transport protein [Cellulomonas oligotrophica]
MTDVPLARRALAELVGTGTLVTVVVGSGIAATRLSPTDVGLQLLQNSTTTALALVVLIAVLGPVSGAHLNPAVTLVLAATGEWRARPAEIVTYAVAQVVGAVGGTVLAHLMFGLPAVQLSSTVRTGPPLWLAEVVATAGLVVVVLGLLWTNRQAWVPAAVGCYIGAAYWFTASTSFANPAVTVGRAFTDTFAGIDVASVGPYVLAQLVGAGVGAALIATLHGRPVLVRARRDPARGQVPGPEAGAVGARLPAAGGA